MRLFGIFLILSVLILPACSNEYQKALKNPDNRKKLELADVYYKKKDFARAITLYEQIEDAYSGTPTAEHILFNSGQCNYALKMFSLAGFQFKTYFESYPTGEHAEEALYMNAYCAYLDSYDPEQDQTETLKAIETFKIFISVFPDSKYVPDCNNYLDKLRGKLSYKAYRVAKLYFDMGEYKSAIVALKNATNDYPEMAQKEELDFLVVKSHFLLAINSIETKQKERFENTILAYQEFKELYPESSKYMDQATEIYNKALIELKKIEKRSQEKNG